MALAYMRPAEIWTLLAGFAFLLMVMNCNSPLYEYLGKIKDAKVRKFIIENLPTIANVGLVAFAFIGRLDLLALSAVLFYLVGNTIHPLNYLFSALIYMWITRRGGSNRTHLFGGFAFVILWMFHVGTTFTAIIGLPDVVYPNCSVK